MVGVNIVGADSDDEARRLATSHRMSFIDLFRGTTRQLLQPPIDDLDTYLLPHEKETAGKMFRRDIVGSVATVRAGIDALVTRTKADELIVVSDVYHFPARRRSFEVIAEAANLTAIASTT